MLQEIGGKDVLLLAGGGGQQSAAFGLLGARVTDLDFSGNQLASDRQAADHYGLKPVLIQGERPSARRTSSSGGNARARCEDVPTSVLRRFKGLRGASLTMRLVELCLITKDVPALAQFYTKVLGVQAVGDETHMALSTEGAALAIFSVQGMESMAPGSMRGAGHGSFTMAFEVDDVDAEYARMQALGVEFVKPPQTHPWGARSFWFRDPDGNIVDFVTVLRR